MHIANLARDVYTPLASSPAMLIEAQHETQLLFGNSAFPTGPKPSVTSGRPCGGWGAVPAPRLRFPAVVEGCFLEIQVPGHFPVCLGGYCVHTALRYACCVNTRHRHPPVVGGASRRLRTGTPSAFPLGFRLEPHPSSHARDGKSPPGTAACSTPEQCSLVKGRLEGAEAGLLSSYNINA